MTFKRCVVNLMLLIQLTNSFAQNLVGTNLRLKPSSLPLTCNDGDTRFDTAVSRTKYCSTNLWTQFADLNSTVAFATASTLAVTANTCGTAAFTSTASTAGTASFAAVAAIASVATASIVATAFATNPSDCSAGQFATTIAANGNLTCTTPANTFGPTFSIVDTNADVPVIKEMLLISRTGGSGTVGTPTRAGAITFRDELNPTYVAMISGVRRDPQNDYTGQMRFYVNNSGTNVTDHNNLGLVLTLDQNSHANFAGNVTAAAFSGTVTTASRSGTSAATEAFSGVLAIANGGTNNGTLAVTNGGIIYGDGSKLMNSGAGTANQVLISNGAAAPTWATIFSNMPSVTAYLTSAGTYTTTVGARWLRVRVVGAGGGGAGSGVGGGGTNGTAGTATTFGASLIIAGGGQPGAWNGGGAGAAGGTCSVTTPALTVVSLPGASGRSSMPVATSTYAIGPDGGATPIGDGGRGGAAAAAGQAPEANTGAGGGGGGNNITVGGATGPGGSAGCYIEALINTPAATYTYSVGIGGAAQLAGTSGYAGGAGSSGRIIIEAYP